MVLRSQYCSNSRICTPKFAPLSKTALHSTQTVQNSSMHFSQWCFVLLWPHFCTVMVNPLAAAHALDHAMHLVPLLILQNHPAILCGWYVWYIVHSAVSYLKLWRSLISQKKNFLPNLALGSLYHFQLLEGQQFFLTTVCFV